MSRAGACAPTILWREIAANHFKSGMWHGKSGKKKARCYDRSPKQDERIDAATILDHPFVRDGGRKNSYIGPSTTDKIGSLVKQRRLSGGRAPPSLSAVVSADDDAPSSKRPRRSELHSMLVRLCKVGNIPYEDQMDTATLSLLVRTRLAQNPSDGVDVANTICSLVPNGAVAVAGTLFLRALGV